MQLIDLLNVLPHCCVDANSGIPADHTSLKSRNPYHHELENVVHFVINRRTSFSLIF